MSLDKPKVLLVDDVETNRIAIRAVLNDLDLDLIECQDGESALKKALQLNFALILLDIQMPNMNGFEVAEYLRGMKQTRNIPIIFITAINKDEQYIFKGYELGAVDYLTKPISPTILISKVKVFLELERSRLEQLQIRSSLEKANQIANEKTYEFQQFASRVAHDLRSPLGNITSFIGLLKDSFQNKIYSKELELLTRIEKGAHLANDIVNGIYSLAELNHQNELTKEILFIENELNRVADDFRNSHVKISIECKDKFFISSIHLPILIRNLISNSIKFCDKKQSIIKIYSKSDDTHTSLYIQDNSTGIPEDKRDKVFIAMERLHGSNIEGLGLGLSMVKKVMDLHCGSAQVIDTLGKPGTLFELSFPNTL